MFFFIKYGIETPARYKGILHGEERMDLRLKDRVALVTGASHGIGKAIALELAKEGAHVVICARNPSRLLAVQEEIPHLRTYIHCIMADCMDPLSAEEVLRVCGSFMLSGVKGRVDILVNNVGGAEKFGDFFTLTDEDWLNAFELNLMSVVRFTREAVPYLRKSGCPRIINISAANARQPGKFNPHYVVAKAGLLALNKILANELAHDGILVNAICPSTLKGGGWERNVKDRAEREGIREDLAEKLMEEEESKKTPLGRIGTPEDVARLVVFLASPLNNYVSGACINIDGGISRSIF